MGLVGIVSEVEPEYSEKNLDWKPNGQTAPGPEIKPGISGPQRGGSTATQPAVHDLMHIYKMLPHNVTQ